MKILLLLKMNAGEQHILFGVRSHVPVITVLSSSSDNISEIRDICSEESDDKKLPKMLILRCLVTL